ncbi:hypothetical protein CER18_04335 [Bartonella tribocorum]|uniref:Uncharacterized protein n=1 Tax=Bartonella tribocorum TaxID=85701 RepID=A0A2M6USQ7_9HYPH|nr:hypothetical protein CER18_04335 [Bartonella tribocorum]
MWRENQLSLAYKATLLRKKEVRGEWTLEKIDCLSIKKHWFLSVKKEVENKHTQDFSFMLLSC